MLSLVCPRDFPKAISTSMDDTIAIESTLCDSTTAPTICAEIYPWSFYRQQARRATENQDMKQ
jgi:hypothetical protein